MSADFELPIHARRGWQGSDFKDIVLFGALFAFFIWRDTGTGDRRTLLGLAAILPAFVVMMAFCYVFDRLTHVQSYGDRYQLFAYAGLAPWTFFSTSRSRSSNRIPYYLESHVTPSGSGSFRELDNRGEWPARPGLPQGLELLSEAGPPSRSQARIQHGWNR